MEEDLVIETDQAMPLIVQGVAMNPNIKILGLPASIGCPVAMDHALAQLARSRTSRLESLTLFAVAKSKESTRTSYPLFLEALKGNFCIQHLYLKDNCTEAMEGAPSIDDLDYMAPWDDDFKAAVEMVSRLNRSGRGYMLEEAANQQLGFEVLEKVNDDLSCLAFHLRENPALCQREMPTMGNERRKRKGLSGQGKCLRPRSV
jgi:hypothetical protein